MSRRGDVKGDSGCSMGSILFFFLVCELGEYACCCGVAILAGEKKSVGVLCLRCNECIRRGDGGVRKPRVIFEEALVWVATRGGRIGGARGITIFSPLGKRSMLLSSSSVAVSVFVNTCVSFK